MQEITVTLSTVNIEGLDAALRAALGTKALGVSIRRGEVSILLDDNAAKADIDQAKAIAAAHDPNALTPAQQAEKDLLALRAANAVPLDPAAYAGESALVQALASKIHWLEREIDALAAPSPKIP